MFSFGMTKWSTHQSLDVRTNLQVWQELSSDSYVTRIRTASRSLSLCIVHTACKLSGTADWATTLSRKQCLQLFTFSAKLTTHPCIVSQNVALKWLSLLLCFVLEWSQVHIPAWICATFINVFVSPSSLRRLKVDQDRFPARYSQLLIHNHLLFYGIKLTQLTSVVKQICSNYMPTFMHSMAITDSVTNLFTTVRATSALVQTTVSKSGK